ncbi:MAG: glycine cleavage system protein GcvH [Coxiellaceae bacterium]|nr:MAG: glycine cleavage system protein GcvH [Coxiellaceae bacterium]
MQDVPADLRYTPSHEWVRLEEDGTLVVGITEYAQNLLGDLVFIELPEIESEVQAGDEIAVVESVKAASDVYAPIGGEIVEVNEALIDMPGTVNNDPYGDGWLFRIKPYNEREYDKLMRAEQYREQIANEESVEDDES